MSIVLPRFGKRPGYTKHEREYGKRQRFPTKPEPVQEEKAKLQFGANNYQNDGSFLEQFYKMQGIKGESGNKYLKKFETYL